MRTSLFLPGWSWAGIQAVVLLATSTVAQAASMRLPVDVEADDFWDAIAGLNQVTETFEGFTPGPTGSSSVTIANGTYRSANPVIAVGRPSHDERDDDRHDDDGGYDHDGRESHRGGHSGSNRGRSNQFISDSSAAAPRSFEVMPNMTFWGADLLLGDDHDEFDVRVEGGSGTLWLNEVDFDDEFAGFHDPLGLFTITFTNVGGSSGHGRHGGGLGRFGFDNIVAAGDVAVVPLPPAAPLMVCALVAVGWLGLRNRPRRDQG